MSAPEDIACRELIERATDYLDDKVPAPERADIDAHLAICEGCATWFDQMRTTRSRLGSMCVKDLLASQRDALRATFRQWRARSSG